VSTYEGVRHSLSSHGIKDSHIRALIGGTCTIYCDFTLCMFISLKYLSSGACASVVGQTIIVPFDVISQHMMIVGMRRSADPRV